VADAVVVAVPVGLALGGALAVAVTGGEPLSVGAGLSVGGPVGEGDGVGVAT
jgi:hypothetical protein